MRRPFCVSVVLVHALLLPAASWAQATIAVIANRTQASAAFALAPLGEKSRDFRLAAGDNLSLPLSASSRLVLAAGRLQQAYTLSPGSAYVLVDRADGVALRTIGLSDGFASAPVVLPRIDWQQLADGHGARQLVVRVKIFVDDDERAAANVWQRRLRARVAEASLILERDCGIKLDVVGFGTWESDDKIQDFAKSLEEFERVVKPAVERLSIGFTSQYVLSRGLTHLGGVHGPLATHLLLREWSQVISEPERLEVLLHELGHFFGAAHSPESNSVMRPILADRRARAAKFRIGLDPLNTLVVSSIGAQIALNAHRQSLTDLDLPAQLALRPIYDELAHAMPADPNPKRYAKMIERAAVDRTATAARAVLTSIELAGAPPRLSTNSNSSSATTVRLLPDRPAAGASLAADARLRAAASAAGPLPPDQQVVACLLAVCLSGPRAEWLASHPLARALCDRIGRPSVKAAEEIPREISSMPRAERVLAVAALASLVGEPLAEAAGLADAGIVGPATGSVDLAAYVDTLAGLCLADALNAPASGAPVARFGSPVVAHLLASVPVEDAPADGMLGRDDFDRRYGSAADPRFLAWREKLVEKLRALAHDSGARAVGAD